MCSSRVSWPLSPRAVSVYRIPRAAVPQEAPSVPSVTVLCHQQRPRAAAGVPARGRGWDGI